MQAADMTTPLPDGDPSGDSSAMVLEENIANLSYEQINIPSPTPSRMNAERHPTPTLPETISSPNTTVTPSDISAAADYQASLDEMLRTEEGNARVEAAIANLSELRIEQPDQIMEHSQNTPSISTPPSLVSVKPVYKSQPSSSRKRSREDDEAPHCKNRSSLRTSASFELKPSQNIGFAVMKPGKFRFMEDDITPELQRQAMRPRKSGKREQPSFEASPSQDRARVPGFYESYPNAKRVRKSSDKPVLDELEPSNVMLQSLEFHRKKIEALENEKQELTLLHSEEQVEKEWAEKELKEAKENLKLKTDEIEEVEASRESLLEENAEMAEALEDNIEHMSRTTLLQEGADNLFQQEVENYEIKMSELEAKHAEAISAKDRTIANLKEFSTSLEEDIKRERTSHQTTRNLVQQASDRLHNETEVQLSMANDLSAQVTDLQSQVTSLDTNIRRKDNENNNLRTEVSDKVTEISRLQKELRGRDRDVTRLREEITRLRDENSTKNRSISSLQHDANISAKQISDLEEEIEEKDTRISNLEGYPADYAKLESDITAQDAKFKAAKLELAKKTAELKVKDKQLAEYQRLANIEVARVSNLGRRERDGIVSEANLRLTSLNGQLNSTMQEANAAIEMLRSELLVAQQALQTQPAIVIAPPSTNDALVQELRATIIGLQHDKSNSDELLKESNKNHRIEIEALLADIKTLQESSLVPPQQFHTVFMEIASICPEEVTVPIVESSTIKLEEYKPQLTTALDEKRELLDEKRELLERITQLSSASALKDSNTTVLTVTEVTSMIESDVIAPIDDPLSTETSSHDEQHTPTLGEIDFLRVQVLEAAPPDNLRTTAVELAASEIVHSQVVEVTATENEATAASISNSQVILEVAEIQSAEVQPEVVASETQVFETPIVDTEAANQAKLNFDNDESDIPDPYILEAQKQLHAASEQGTINSQQAMEFEELYALVVKIGREDRIKRYALESKWMENERYENRNKELKAEVALLDKERITQAKRITRLEKDCVRQANKIARLENEREDHDVLYQNKTQPIIVLHSEAPQDVDTPQLMQFPMSLKVEAITELAKDEITDKLIIHQATCSHEASASLGIASAAVDQDDGQPMNSDPPVGDRSASDGGNGNQDQQEERTPMEPLELVASNSSSCPRCQKYKAQKKSANRHFRKYISLLGSDYEQFTDGLDTENINWKVDGSPREAEDCTNEFDCFHHRGGMKTFKGLRKLAGARVAALKPNFVPEASAFDTIEGSAETPTISKAEGIVHDVTAVEAPLNIPNADGIAHDMTATEAHMDVLVIAGAETTVSDAHQIPMEVFIVNEPALVSNSHLPTDQPKLTVTVSEPVSESELWNFGSKVPFPTALSASLEERTISGPEQHVSDFQHSIPESEHHSPEPERPISELEVLIGGNLQDPTEINSLCGDFLKVSDGLEILLKTVPTSEDRPYAFQQAEHSEPTLFEPEVQIYPASDVQNRPRLTLFSFWKFGACISILCVLVLACRGMMGHFAQTQHITAVSPLVCEVLDSSIINFPAVPGAPLPVSILVTNVCLNYGIEDSFPASASEPLPVSCIVCGPPAVDVSSWSKNKLKVATYGTATCVGAGYIGWHYHDIRAHFDLPPPVVVAHFQTHVKAAVGFLWRNFGANQFVVPVQL